MKSFLPSHKPQISNWCTDKNKDQLLAPVADLAAEKHEIYVAAFDGRIFNDLFLRSRMGGGGMSPGSATVFVNIYCFNKTLN